MSTKKANWNRGLPASQHTHHTLGTVPCQSTTAWLENKNSRPTQGVCRANTRSRDSTWSVLHSGGGSEKTKRQQFVTWWCLAGGELERQLLCGGAPECRESRYIYSKVEGYLRGHVATVSPLEGRLTGHFIHFFSAGSASSCFFHWKGALRGSHHVSSTMGEFQMNPNGHFVTFRPPS